MAEEEAPRKRSRFDQTEPPRKSRFDRRSRSPARGDGADTSRRSRSPVAKSTENGDDKRDAAAAAAAAAAKINASINAKKGIQHVDVPPIRATQSPSATPGAAKSPSQSAPSGTLNAEIYTQDGDYIKDIEVNDLRNRYTLTKGSTQKMIKEKTGADVTTRGNYYPDKSLATAANPPLYLHVTSTSKEGLEKAIKEIDELMQVELPNLIDERRFRRHGSGQEGGPGGPGGPPERPPPFERDALGRRKWPEERIPIDLEPIPGFNLRAQVVGAGGSYVKYIQAETRCRVQIKGRGSGFMEHDTGRESDEMMYLHVAGPDADEVQNAKRMCLELLDTVRAAYNAHKERPPRGSGGFGGNGYAGDRGPPRDRNSGSYGGEQPQYGAPGGYQQPGYGQQAYAQGYGGAQSPTAAQTPAQTGSGPIDLATIQQMQAWATYYEQNPTADPMATSGGYAAYVRNYLATLDPYALQQAYASQTPTQQNGAPPPPPPDDSVPPPPPGASGNPGYSAVPPPPGM
ncbi:hypothetical protein EJ03DRAFT_326799 [Teratosphaeria nubilosa]|uniref:K Homology domain-containing protein n=1 Tax=Teratosphaeria nubilosa TaxID=161662 RepID=A0A6G1LB33_9PEZI|nr:hypothetical protein EJ03DRAFT_326799 [Teratosphaeria nubilosa]